MKDKFIRSLAKSITWRIAASVVLSILTYAITGSIELTAYITITYQLVQIILYTIHERVWNRIDFGRSK